MGRTSWTKICKNIDFVTKSLKFSKMDLWENFRNRPEWPSGRKKLMTITYKSCDYPNCNRAKTEAFSQSPIPNFRKSRVTHRVRSQEQPIQDIWMEQTSLRCGAHNKKMVKKHSTSIRFRVQFFMYLGFLKEHPSNLRRLSHREQPR